MLPAGCLKIKYPNCEINQELVMLLFLREGLAEVLAAGLVDVGPWREVRARPGGRDDVGVKGDDVPLALAMSCLIVRS